MRRLLVSLPASLVALVTACPADPQVTSIPEDLVVNSLTATATTTKNADVTDLAATTAEVDSLTAETISSVTASVEALTAGTCEVTSVHAASASIDGEVAAASINTNTIIHRGFTLFGVPLGTASYQGNPNLGYRGVDELCATATGEDTAHVCSAEEVLTAFRTGIEVSADFDNAAVNTFSFAVALSDQFAEGLNGGSAPVPGSSWLADDCNGWNSTDDLGGGFQATSSNGSDPVGGSLPAVWPAGHTYVALHRLDDGAGGTFSWTIRPPFLPQNCSQVKLACCG